ncbi:cysteine desulfurase family protein [Sesbania bispinosa]|nr:cysteine desulfurase family protein [Sesbania bispinosa]
MHMQMQIWKEEDGLMEENADADANLKHEASWKKMQMQMQIWKEEDGLMEENADVDAYLNHEEFKEEIMEVIESETTMGTITTRNKIHK